MNLQPTADDATGDAAAADRRSPASKLRRFVFSVLRICLLGYVTICVTLVIMESRLVYPGAYSDQVDSQQTRPRLSDMTAITYTSAAGTEHSGRLISPQNARRFVLFLHGNGSQALSLDNWTRGLSKRLDAVVLTAEYRGFDGTDFTPNEASVVADSVAAIDELCRRYSIKPTDVIVYGRSLGGGAAAAVAESRGAGAIVLERTFDKLYKVGAGMYPLVPVSLLMQNRYDSVKRLQSFTGPVIQVHGRTDQLIPITHAKTLAASMNSDQFEWIEVPVLGHNDSLPESVHTQITQFIQDAMPALSQNQPAPITGDSSENSRPARTLAAE